VSRAPWPLLLALATFPAMGLAPPGPATCGYHGGALLITGPGPVPGHLAPGQVLPIRLARLAPERSGGRPDFEGAEDPASVRFGRMDFLQVGPDRVRFRVKLRRPDGAWGPARTVALGLGEGVDLDGCGQEDVALEPPARPLPGRAAAYARLAFRCDARHTTLFALDPAAFPGARYPCGLIGLTPSGHFIFQSDHLPLHPAGPGRARLAAEPEPALVPGPGDVLVDTVSGRLRPVDQALRDEHGWDIHYRSVTTPFQFTKVYGAAFIHVHRRIRPAGGTGGRPLADPVAFDATRTLLDDAQGRLDLQVAARLEVDLDLCATLNWHGLAAELGAHLDPSLRLAIDYRAGRPLREEFGPWTLANPKLGFLVGGIPLSISLPVTCGLTLANETTGKALEGFRCNGHWRWTGRVAARWSWKGVSVEAPPPVAEHSVVLEALPENHAEMGGQAELRPWVELAATFGVADVLFGEFPVTLDLQGTLAGRGPGGGLEARLAAHCRLAVGLNIRLPVLGQVWGQRWPLHEWTGPIGPPLRLPVQLETVAPTGPAATGP
jgi:hypothetical protein